MSKELFTKTELGKKVMSDDKSLYPNPIKGLKQLMKKHEKKHEMAKKMKPFQTSKEYHGGKWQKVGFFKNKKGDVSVKPMK